MCSSDLTTTHGRPISDSEWKAVERACDLTDKLEEAKRKVNSPPFYLQEDLTIVDRYSCTLAHV